MDLDGIRWDRARREEICSDTDCFTTISYGERLLVYRESIVQFPLPNRTVRKVLCHNCGALLAESLVSSEDQRVVTIEDLITLMENSN